MTPGAEHAAGSLDGLEPGTHLCAFHRDRDRLIRIASTYTSHALAAGDRVLYVTTDEQADSGLTALTHDVHADDARRAGQLPVRSFAEAYGTRRPEDLGTVADGFRAAAARARKDGFRGLRVPAHMDDLAPERAKQPLARFRAVHEPWGQRVSGEVDVSNRDDLLQVLRARAAVTHRIHVDLEHPTFADVGSLARIRAVAASLPESGSLILGRVPDAIRRTLSLSGLHHERLRMEP